MVIKMVYVCFVIIELAIVPSVLWHCRAVGKKKGIRLVNDSVGVLEYQLVQLLPPSLITAKSTMVWYYGDITQVIQEYPI